ncbi:hypothetical protein R6Q59_030369 [Mikania micrantha]
MSPCCSQAPSLDAANRRLLPAAANRRLLPAAAHWSPPPAASHHLVLPCSCVFQQVQQAIKPQAAAFQSGEKTMQHGESIDDGENTHGQLPRLLDIVLYLCENEHIEGEMIFQLLEDLTEMSTMKNCEDVFGYIESKQHILGKPELFARGKLVMLRTCNQLLRRLSMANDMVFCGRIIMFLAHFFPLSERSVVRFGSSIGNRATSKRGGGRTNEKNE